MASSSSESQFSFSIKSISKEYKPEYFVGMSIKKLPLTNWTILSRTILGPCSTLYVDDCGRVVGFAVVGFFLLLFHLLAQGLFFFLFAFFAFFSDDLFALFFFHFFLKTTLQLE